MKRNVGMLSAIVVLALAAVPAFAAGSRRVYTTLKIDDRRDKKAAMQAKVASVKKKLSSEG